MQAVKSTVPNCHSEDAPPLPPHTYRKVIALDMLQNQQIFGLLGQSTQNRYIHMIFSEANFFFVLCIIHVSLSHIN